MNNFLLIIQVVVSVLLAAVVLVQQRGAALGSAFGGEGSSFHSKRRGLEKHILIATIVLCFLFVILALLNLKF